MVVSKMYVISLILVKDDAPKSYQQWHSPDTACLKDLAF